MLWKFLSFSDNLLQDAYTRISFCFVLFLLYFVLFQKSVDTFEIAHVNVLKLKMA